MILNPSLLSVEQVYNLLVTVIVPRPIALVSSVSTSGIRNLAPFSYFNMGGIDPPSLVICPLSRPNGLPKDTLANARDTGEFCVNLVTREMADGMNVSSAGLAPEQDEWPLTGLTPAPCETIRPERVLESPISLECRTHEVIEVGKGCYLIGIVQRIHVEDSLWDSGSEMLNTDDIPLIARLGGPRYLDLSTLERFELQRPG